MLIAMIAKKKEGTVAKFLREIIIAVVLVAVLTSPCFSKDKSKGKSVKAKKKSEVFLLKKRLLLLEEKLKKMDEEESIRNRLKSTEEEKESDGEEILSAAGRDYTLMKPGILGLEYNLRYAGYSYDSGIEYAKIEHNADHSITNSMVVEYPLKDNITFSGDFSFVAKMNTQSNSSVKDVTDLGDTVFGVQWQPVKSGGGGVTKIISGSLICPTGRSPYKIDRSKEVSTGSGGYSSSIGLNMSKKIDPLFVYGSIRYQYPFEIKNLNYKIGNQGEQGMYLRSVRPGHTFSYSMGFGYSLSYNVSLNFGYQYSYTTKSRYNWVGREDHSSEDAMSSMFSIGTGWSLFPKRTINVKLSFGLTNNDPDFIVSLRIPFKFEL